MTPHTRIMTLLLIAIALGFGAIPAVQALEPADLALAKALQTEGPFYAGDQVVWVLTLTNNGPAEATDIVVTEDLTGIGEYTLGEVTASAGTFDPSGGTDEAHPIWSIPALANGATATLTLPTTVVEEGDKENSAAVTALEDDLVPENNQASASTGVGPSTTAEIIVKPETLNLGSRGVFTVFIKFGEDYPVEEIDLGASSLVCNGAASQKLRVTQKDGGMVMAKFRRLDLDEMEPGDEVTIACEGTISSGGETVGVTGEDTIRVIGKKKTGLDAFLTGILDTILPLDDETEEGADGDATTTATTTTPAREQDRNRGQLKKASGDGEPECTGDCSTADSQGTKGNGKKAGASDDDTVTDSQGKGNHGNDKNEGTGNGNGKGNSNPPEMENGNGKGKN